MNKALDVLEIFLHVKDDKLSLAQLSKLAGMNKATVDRIAILLAKRGYLLQAEKRGKYSLGFQFIHFYNRIKQANNYVEIAIPHMMALSRSCHECVILTVLDGECCVIIEVIESKHLLRTAPQRGTVLPLYCTGQGKVILAFMNMNEIGNYLNKVDLRRYTRNTITDTNELKKHLKMVLKDGVAYDIEEEMLDINNVAAPLRNADGKVFSSVGIIGPAIRLTPSKMQDISPELKVCAQAISREIGYQD
jgi:DNA-binding IclR family transcriptional regulator